MARLKEAARKFLKDRNACSSSSSQSPKRSPSPPSAPAPKGTKSTPSTSFKSLSDHENDVEIQSAP
ncbi:hypothetical protein A2U01_0102723, partial [Trifolium medium]|nr:hypothetical protein [Trifolium medium]